MSTGSPVSPLVVALVVMVLTVAFRATDVTADRWVVCYTDTVSTDELSGYGVVVLDADYHPPLAPLVARRQTVLAYLSATELGRGRRVFAALDAAGVMLAAHDIWPDAHYVDIRRPEWRKAVLDDLVPRSMAEGFHGLFLDTLDDVEMFETQDPVRFKGMRQAAVDLVIGIRERYPSLVLMVNRGYALMPALARSVDILLGESVMTSFDPATKAYRRMTTADVEWQVERLRAARASNPALKIFTLDYWNPADTAGLERIYREERARGFIPYVATPLLDQVVKEPR